MGVAWLLRNKVVEDPTVCQPGELNEHVRTMLGEMRVSLTSVAVAFPNLATSDMLRSNLGHDSMCLANESNKECQNRVAQPAFREDCHWLPQWMYVEGECEHVMRTETLFVVDTETCGRHIIGIPAWLGRSSERQLPAV